MDTKVIYPARVNKSRLETITTCLEDLKDQIGRLSKTKDDAARWLPSTSGLEESVMALTKEINHMKCDAERDPALITPAMAGILAEKDSISQHLDKVIRMFLDLQIGDHCLPTRERLAVVVDTWTNNLKESDFDYNPEWETQITFADE